MATDAKPPLPLAAFTVPQVAEITNLSDGTIWGELRDGEMESCLVGDRRLITPAQLDAWLARKAARAAEARQNPKPHPPAVAQERRRLEQSDGRRGRRAKREEARP